MLRKIIHRLLKRRHFWRYATFDEVAELYAAKLLRSLALNLAAVFIVVYMYQLGYSLAFIATYLILYMSGKAAMSLPAGAIVARIGPKHAMLLGNLLYAPAMFLFTLLPEYGPVILLATSLFQICSATIYDIGHAVDFSRVKDVNHTGKELGFMNLSEKIATGVSPFIGGVIAFLLGPHAMMIIAAVLFGLAALPLFRTGEQVRLHQRLVLRGFPWRTTWRSLRAYVGNGYDAVSSTSLWSLFVVIAVVASTSDSVYAQLGGYASITLLAAFAASYVYGKLIDRQRGGLLLKFATIASGLVHAARSFVSTPFDVVITNVTHETATVGYRMAYDKGAFDLADRTGHRVTYMSLLQLSHCIGAALAAAAFLVCISVWGEQTGFKVFFVTAAIAVLLVVTARFPLYRK